MKIKALLIRVQWFISSQLGLNPTLLFISIINLPRYVRDLFSFKKEYKGKISLMPCLTDFKEEAGATKSEYFWQDLVVAQSIFKQNPIKHVDIGSRIDGFVSHVASFRQIELLDIRDMTSNIPNVTFKKVDLMGDLSKYEDYCDSISCLHAIEHFGLGRYGDPINPEGYTKGLKNISKILKEGGYLYISTPIGQEKVCFNAHRIFNPLTIVTQLKSNGLTLEEFSFFHNGQIENCLNSHEKLITLSELEYSLGIFKFKKSFKSNA